MMTVELKINGKTIGAIDAWELVRKILTHPGEGGQR